MSYTDLYEIVEGNGIRRKEDRGGTDSGLGGRIGSEPDPRVGNVVTGEKGVGQASTAQGSKKDML